MSTTRLRRAVVAALALLLGAAPGQPRAQGVTVDVTVNAVPTTGGTLGLRRVALAFPDGRYDALVTLGGALGVRATFDYLGTGLLTGRFVVDGTPLQEFNEVLTYGATKVIDLAPLPGLPTFEPGLHEVTLQLTSPGFGAALPVLRYTVTTRAAPGAGAITLLEPGQGVAAAFEGAPGAAPALGFLWLQDGAPAPTYRVEVLPIQADGTPSLNPRWTAQVTGQSWRLSSAAPPGPKYGPYAWRVKALDAAGAALATSPDGRFTLVAAQEYPITITEPVTGARVVEQLRVTFGSSLTPLRYEARAYRNDAALEEDLRLLGLGQGALAADPAQLADRPTKAGSSNARTLSEPLQPADPALAAPAPRGQREARLDPSMGKAEWVNGRVFRLVVVAFDQGGRLVGRSAAVTFVVGDAPNGRPTVLDFAGQEVEVTAEKGVSTLAAFAGEGRLQFRRDRARQGVPLTFSGLALDTPYLERRRVVSGSGLGETVTLLERVRALVSAGAVSQLVLPPVALDLPGAALRVGQVTLRAGPAPAAGQAGSAALDPGAWADLTLGLPGYLHDAKGGPISVALPATRLGAGGDFLRLVSSGAVPALAFDEGALGPLALAEPGALVADFSSAADAVDEAGAPVPADGMVYLAGARLELPASALFATLEPSALHLTARLLELGPTASAALRVAGSDTIHPVSPGGYALEFTGGTLALAGGALQPGAVSLDGRAVLPVAVQGAEGGAAVVGFQGMKVVGGHLEAAVDVGGLRWGGPIITGALAPAWRGGRGSSGAGLAGLVGAQALRLALAVSLARPPGAVTPPVSSAPVAPPPPPPAVVPAPPPGMVLPAPPPAAVAPVAPAPAASTPPLPTPVEPVVVAPPTGAQIGAGGTVPIATGPAGGLITIPPAVLAALDGAQIATSLTPLGEPPEPRTFTLVGARGKLSFGWLGQDDGQPAGLTVTSGSLSGPFELDPSNTAGLLPADDLSLHVAPQGVTGTAAWAGHPAAGVSMAAGGGKGSRLEPRDRFALAGGFRARLSSFSLTFAAGAVTASALAGELTVPAPAAVSLTFKRGTLTGGGELVGPVVTLPAQVALPAWRVVLEGPDGLELSRSSLRVTGGALRFPVAAASGGEELSALEAKQLQLGVDGRIQLARTGVTATFVGLPFTLASEEAVAFATLADGPTAPGQDLVTLTGVFTFPGPFSKAGTIQHTDAGARVRLTDPRYARGSPDLIQATGELTWVNGYQAGKGYKEFLGLGRLSILQAASVNGLAMFGGDGQGTYERYGLGIGVDGQKVATLTSAEGAVSTAAKLGAGTLALVTEKSPHVGELTQLTSGLADYLKTADKLTKQEKIAKLMKLLGDAVGIAKAVHVETGGKADDAVGTSLDLAQAGLAQGATLAGQKTVDDKQRVLAILGSLDVAFPILERAAGVKGQKEALAALELVRLAVKATRYFIEDWQLSDREQLLLARDLFRSAKGIEGDGDFQLALDLVIAVLDTVSSEKPLDGPAVARLASTSLGLVQAKGVLPGQDWKNVLALAQALLDAAVRAADLPYPDSAISLGGALLEAASGPKVSYGPEGDAKVKPVLALTRRLLQVYGAVQGGIPSEKAAASVRDTYDTAAAAVDLTQFDGRELHQVVRRLIGVWSGLKARPLADSAAELTLVLCEAGADPSCLSADAYGAQVAAAAARLASPGTPEGFLRILQELQILAATAAERAGATPADLTFRDRYRAALEPSVGLIRALYDNLVTTSFLPAIQQAATVEAAKPVARLAGALNAASSGIAAAVDWREVHPELLLQIDMATQTHPVNDALEAKVFATLLPELLKQVTAAKETTALVPLWEGFLAIRESTLTFTSKGQEQAKLVEEAFKKRVMELCDEFFQAGRTEPYAPLASLEGFSESVLRLPGAGMSAAMGATLGGTAQFKAWAEGANLTASSAAYNYFLLLGSVLSAEGMTNIIGASMELPSGPGAPSTAAVDQAVKKSMGVSGAYGIDPVEMGSDPIMSKILTPTVVAALLTLAAEEVQQDRVTVGTLFVQAIARPMVASGAFADPEAQKVLTEQATKKHLASADPAVLLESLATAWGPEALTIAVLRELIDPNVTPSPSDALSRASRHRLLTRLPGREGELAQLESRAPGWIAAAKAAPCAKRPRLKAWFRAVAPFLPGKKADLLQAQYELSVGCGELTYDPREELAKLKTAGPALLAEVDAVLKGPQAEADKQAAIGWLIAGRLEAMTDGFKGERPEEKLLRATHQQVAFVTANRQSSRTERVAAIGKILSAALGDLLPDQRDAGTLQTARLVVDLSTQVLGAFEAGGQKAFSWQQAIQLAAAAAGQVAGKVDKSGAGKQLIGAWVGLLKATGADKEASLQSVAVATVPLAVAGGIGLAMADKIVLTDGKVNLGQTFGKLGLQGEFWDGLALHAPQAVDLVVATQQLMKLIDGLKAAKGQDAKAQLAALKKFAAEAPRLAVIGPFLGALVSPEANLSAPDVPLEAYEPTAVLALLDTSRLKVPGGDSKPADSTCLSVTNPNVPQGADAVLCLIDVARGVVRGPVAALFLPDTSPTVSQDAAARALVEEARSRAVFARGVGGEDLSGLSGGLEYRAGQLSRFELYGTLEVKGMLEAAVLATYDTRQTYFSLELATATGADKRDPGLLGMLGLTPASNDFLGKGTFQSPLKRLVLHVDGQARCADGLLSLTLDGPLGRLTASETRLAACWNPVSLDLATSWTEPVLGPVLGTAGVRLCYAGGRGGLDLSASVGLDTPNLFPEPVVVDGWGRANYWKEWGLRASLAAGAGLALGPSGLEVAAGARAELGVSVTNKDEPNCVGQPLVLGLLFPGSAFVDPTLTYKASRTQSIRYGTCRSLYAAQLDLKVQSASRSDFGLKGQGEVDVGPASLGLWFYKGAAGSDWGTGSFPPGQYGGWPASSGGPTAGWSVCGGTL